MASRFNKSTSDIDFNLCMKKFIQFIPNLRPVGFNSMNLKRLFNVELFFDADIYNNAIIIRPPDCVVDFYVYFVREATMC